MWCVSDARRAVARAGGARRATHRMKRASESSPSDGKRPRGDGDDEWSDDEDVWSGADLPEIIPNDTNVKVIAGDHSGKSGTICGFEADEAYDGCYGVELWVGGRPTFVDRGSLLPRYVVTLLDLVSRADLNGKQATIENFEEERQRYEVELSHDRSRIKLQPANMRLPVGSRLRIHGLVSATQHNGKLAKVAAYLEESGRYDVELAQGSQPQGVRLKVKRENVRL